MGQAARGAVEKLSENKMYGELVDLYKNLY